MGRPTMLLILDGWGLAEPGPGNAIHLARTPSMDRLRAENPHARLTCFGPAVGLPQGRMGNSEVGHLNLGAGRVVFQDIARIDQAIASGEFEANPALTGIMDRVRGGGGALHLLGLLSEGGVHSSLNHLRALIGLAKAKGLSRVFLHPFLDGRDTPPDSGAGFLEEITGFLERTGLGQVATLGGRYWGMDRDKRWDRVARHYAALVRSQGVLVRDPVRAVREAYSKGEGDEFIAPSVIVDQSGQPLGPIQDGDGVIFFNFRADRARELTQALALDGLAGFETGPRPRLCGFVTMTLYDEKYGLPVAFPPQRLECILGQVVSEAGLAQLRIAETEKYAHVTYFFNGGREEPFPGEERILVPSPREVATYDLKPQMSAPEVCDRVLAEMERDFFDLIVLNFANLDMVGHTGVLEAAVRACETVDRCLGRIAAAVAGRRGSLVVTADHGNAEMMIAPDGQPHTAHTSDHQVPFILAGEPKVRLRPEGVLADVAPTILELMSLDKPVEMTGLSMIKGRTP